MHIIEEKHEEDTCICHDSGIDTNYSSDVTYGPLSGTTYANPVYSQHDDPTGIVKGEASITIPGNPDFESDIRINFQ